MPKVTGFCRGCAKAMEFYPSQPRIFCSRACDIDWHKRAKLSRKPRRGTTTPCETCGTPVYANQSERAKGAGRYCSYACHNIGQSKPPVIKPCGVCGKEMSLKPSQAGRRYCSRDCMGRASIKRPLNRTHNGKPVRLDPHGYVLMWEPGAGPSTLKGWAYEHRVIASKILGRTLTSEEQVDHINRNKQDNRPENLQVLDGLAHSAKTAADNKQDRIDLAEYRERYGPLNEPRRCEELVGNREGQCTRQAVVRSVASGAGSWHYYCRQHIRSIANNTTRGMTVVELATGEGWTA